MRNFLAAERGPASAASVRPIRVVNVVARLNVGGPAILVTLITQHMGQPEYESVLVTGTVSGGEGDMTYYATEHGVTPIVLPTLGRELHPIRDLSTLWKLVRLFRELRPDVVATHTAKAGFVGRVAARLAGAPVVVHTFHGHVFHGYFSPAKTRLFLMLERLTARLSDTIIVLTPRQRDELVQTYHIAPASKFRVIGAGLDLARFAAMPRKNGTFRQAWGVVESAPLITIVGRLTPVKNHALFLQAAAIVRQSLPEARFAIVGDGELRAELEAQVDALGLRDAVFFTGWQKDVAPVVADSDVLVISSVNEGTPLTVIEAMAAGCPAVCTAVGGVPDLLQNGELGALVPSGDADALAGAILRVIQSPPNADGLRALAVERYGIDRLVRDLDALYRELLTAKRKIHHSGTKDTERLT
jgi:glycosyltransferase involved in cell wall biosynthesis